MARYLFVRITGALGATSLAVLLVGLVPFLSVDAGAGFAPRAPDFTVNREFKGDRLPLPANLNYSRRVFGSKQQANTPQDIPVGCDGSFSPISTPRMAYIFGRCVT